MKLSFIHSWLLLMLWDYYLQTSLQHAIILFFVYPEIFPKMVEFIVKVQNVVCKISPFHQMDFGRFLLVIC